MTKKPDEKHATIYFSDAYQKVRDAERVFKAIKNDPSLFSQDKQGQRILCDALIALGQQRGLLPSDKDFSADSVQPVLEAVNELKKLVENQYSSLEARINKLAERGVISTTQATQINEEIDSETKQFALNMKTSLRGGKR